MPAMANITVKKADGTTDITYDALTGAAGNGSEAVWRQDTGAATGVPVGHRATLRFATNDNGPKTARTARLVYKRPYSTQNTVTSKYEAADSVVVNITVTMPNAIPASEVSEAVYQAANLHASALVKSSISAGYAPQ